MLSREQRPDGRTKQDKRPLFAVSRVHLESMSTEIGVWQHAKGADPDQRFGYCTDDVARALVVDTLHARELGWDAVQASARRSFRFLDDAFDHSSGRFLNFRDADGRWLDVDASQDCHARALMGLATLMVEAPGTELADQARELFVCALPAVSSFDAMRPISAVLIACDLVIGGHPAVQAQPAFDRLAMQLAMKFGDPAADWPWPDPLLTYENALVAQALITAGRRLGNQPMLAKGCSVLDWLIDVQTGECGAFSPIGNGGWWPRAGRRAQFDQQPIEAATMVSAAAAAFRATGLKRYVEAAEMAYAWFLGDNDLEMALADPTNGSCCDGLTPAGPNENQGGESTLMWLTALEVMRGLRTSTRRGFTRAAPGASAGNAVAPSAVAPSAVAPSAVAGVVARIAGSHA